MLMLVIHLLICLRVGWARTILMKKNKGLVDGDARGGCDVHAIKFFPCFAFSFPPLQEAFSVFSHIQQ